MGFFDKNDKKIDELMVVTKENSVLNKENNESNKMVFERIEELTEVVNKQTEIVNKQMEIVTSLSLSLTSAIENMKSTETKIVEIQEEINSLKSSMKENVSEAVSEVIINDKDFDKEMDSIKYLFNGALYKYPEKPNGAKVFNDYGKRITYRNWDRYLFTGDGDFVKLADSYVWNFFLNYYLPEFYSGNKFLGKDDKTKVDVIHEFLTSLVNNEALKSDFVDFILSDYEKGLMGKDNKKYLDTLFESKRSKFKVRKFIMDKLKFTYYEVEHAPKETTIEKEMTEEEIKKAIVDLCGGSIKGNPYTTGLKKFGFSYPDVYNCPLGTSKLDYVVFTMKKGKELYDFIKEVVDNKKNKL